MKEEGVVGVQWETRSQRWNPPQWLTWRRNIWSFSSQKPEQMMVQRRSGLCVSLFCCNGHENGDICCLRIRWQTTYSVVKVRGRGRRLAQLVAWVSHVPRLCSDMQQRDLGRESNPGPFAACHSPSLNTVSCHSCQAIQSIKPERLKKSARIQIMIIDSSFSQFISPSPPLLNKLSKFIYMRDKRSGRHLLLGESLSLRLVSKPRIIAALVMSCPRLFMLTSTRQRLQTLYWLHCMGR